ncbi:type VII toxin-antitoxin system MntA family adenylyltransferase antitoxin [Salibacterium qingdaonense]|uniref:Polymerase beta nucleotidyltransferase domain-containing protein n=1 Tax=Salibacterium qingdaonense TaxID=266892 RepID=A0A1I4KI35_9BACI|nr:nucleotidyltransferase domain-containing protein [Salibacterium qingdaonense]SFL78428.1 hypothetical protein SAMN04488054_10529 [Salibacterium qingdaonense]
MEHYSAGRDAILSSLKEVVTQELDSRHVRVYLFGSWAKGTEKQSSDIDLAIETERDLDASAWNRLLEAIEESTVPYHVDVVDLQSADPAFTRQVKREGLVWKDFTNV